MNNALARKRILVTRPEARATSLVAKLEGLGAIPMRLPALRFEPVSDFVELDESLSHIAKFDVVVFTSVTGVEFVSARMAELGLSSEVLARRKLAVIGPATAAAVEAWLRKPDLMPEEYVAEAIADELGDVAGLRILLLRADLARPDLQKLLRSRGALVTEISAYRILPSSVDDFDWNCPPPDIITLTSAASARFVVEALAANNRTDWLESSRIVCIGPITRDAVRAMGYRVAGTATSYTEDGLVQAVLNLQVAHA